MFSSPTLISAILKFETQIIGIAPTSFNFFSTRHVFLPFHCHAKMEKELSKIVFGRCRKVECSNLTLDELLTFKKLLKNRIVARLKHRMTQFYTRGVNGKRVADKLCMFRAHIDYCRYLKREVWITFYDIEKCFESLWLDDCIVSLSENGVDFIHRMTRKAEIVVKTLFGDTVPFLIDNLVKQGTVIGPILNNCSLDKVCKQ